ncbi:hypothetical protein Agub_g15008, partial [Astrephomene gubernaculifera]
DDDDDEEEEGDELGTPGAGGRGGGRGGAEGSSQPDGFKQSQQAEFSPAAAAAAAAAAGAAGGPYRGFTSRGGGSSQQPYGSSQPPYGSSQAYGTQASQYKDPYSDLGKQQRSGKAAPHPAASSQAPRWAAAAAKATGAVHLVLVLANDGCGDVQCQEVLLEDAPHTFKVVVPPLQDEDTSLAVGGLQGIKLPYIDVLPAPPSEYGIPGYPRRTTTASSAPSSSATPAAAAAAGPSVAMQKEGSGGGGAGGAGAGVGVSSTAATAAAAAPPPPPRTLADACWRPSRLGDMHVLTLAYPPCRALRQELGERLVSEMAGARSHAYGVVGYGDPLWGRWGRAAQLSAEFVMASTRAPDTGGIALLSTIIPTNSSSSSGPSAYKP